MASLSVFWEGVDFGAVALFLLFVLISVFQYLASRKVATVSENIMIMSTKTEKEGGSLQKVSFML